MSPETQLMGVMLGVLFHWLGGLASGSFYLPYRFVKKWSWETMWLVGGFFSWLIAPSVLAYLLVPDVPGVLGEAKKSAPEAIKWAYIFGACWGFGGLTFGLTMRYLGIGLGMAIALAYCAAFGTLVPPIKNGEFMTLLQQTPGQVILVGVAICLSGIIITGMAGMKKEKELPEEIKKESIKEFNFFKGIAVATFSGIMSACFAFGLDAGKPIGAIAKQHLTASGGSDLWQNLPVLIVVLWGGFTTNFIWCFFLNIKNKSGLEYFKGTKTELVEVTASGQEIESAAQVGDHGAVATKARAAAATVRERVVAVPMLANYVFAALAGTTWYFQFFFYSMGQTKMGKYEFSSWTLHMSSIIIFSSLWGIALKEWKGTSSKTRGLVFAGILVLILATIVVGYGNYLNTLPQYAKAAATAAGH